MNDRTYNVRVHFIHGNAITLDLKGCGSLYIKPYKDYYFINSPINFINYLAQLKRMGITYEITDNKRGCYQEIDLSHYNFTDPRYIISNLRKINVLPDADTFKPAEVEEDKSIVLSSDDNIKVETVEVEEAIIPPVEINAEPVEEPTDEVSEEITEEVEETNEELPVYTEKELSAMSKNKLLEIATKLGIDSVSDINTKKEIREAILDIQK